MKSFPFYVLLALAVITGCAKPVFDLAEPGEGQRAKARTVLGSTPLTPPLGNAGRQAMKDRMDRVIPIIRSATHQVCERRQLESARCAESMKARIRLYDAHPMVNAYADEHDEIYVFGGVLKVTGTDAEVAAIIAHEISHVMLGHVQRKKKNMMTGMLLAGALAGGVGLATGTDSSAYGESWMNAGMIAGSRAYSPKMEIEADRLAIYIIKEAGYPTTSMRDAIVRMHRAVRLRRIGFLQTHPSNDRRIAHILSAINDAEAGVPLKAHVRRSR